MLDTIARRRGPRSIIWSCFFALILALLFKLGSHHSEIKSRKTLSSAAMTGTDVNVVLAGNTFEGGGGLIRDALTYSAILGKSIRIEKIRADRPGAGGLRVEHTVAISTMVAMCNGVDVGNVAESRTMSFWPYRKQSTENLQPKDYFEIDLEGAASISLIALLPFLLFSHLSPVSEAARHISKDWVRLDIKAGTLAVKAPSYHFLQHVLLPTFETIGLSGHIKLSNTHNQGWHTQSARERGFIQAWIKPLQKPLPAFKLLGRGRVVEIIVIGTVPLEHTSQFEGILHKESKQVFGSSTGSSIAPTISIKVIPSTVFDQYHLFISARTEAPTAYLGYEQVYPQSDVFSDSLQDNPQQLLQYLARVCILGLVNELRTRSAVDDHMADILAPYMVLASGQSTVSFESADSAREENGVFQLEGIGQNYHVDTTSLHKQTSHWVAKQMTDAKFETNDRQDTCFGIGVGTGESLL